MELEKVRDEIHRKIGMNMLLLQEVEYLLKHLIANGKVAGPISEIKGIRQRQIESVKTKMLGQLVKQYVEDTHRDKEITEIPENLEEPHFSFFVKVECSPEEYENKKKTLEDIVAERNKLIHHFLPRLCPDSIENWMKVDEYLEQQHAKILPEKAAFRSTIATMHKAAEYLASEEYKNELKSSVFRENPLIVKLVDFAGQFPAGSDGWICLAPARKELWKKASEEMKLLSMDNTLKDLILATGIFDLAEGREDNGDIQLFYRLKPEWKVERVNPDNTDEITFSGTIK